MPAEVRVAELLTAMSLATDLGQGQPMDWGLRSCLLAMDLSARAALDAAARRDVYDLSLLRYIGCTSHAHEVASTFGDEIVARDRFLAVDLTDKRAVGRNIVNLAGSNRALPGRIKTVVSTLTAGVAQAAEGFRASCEVAERFADRLGFDATMSAALHTSFERWDGKGLPRGAAGEEIPLAMRVVQIAQDGEVLERRHGIEVAADAVRARAGTMYEPQLALLFADSARAMFAQLEDVDPWGAVLSIEPDHPRVLRGTTLDDALTVVADYTDLKSAFGGGHSRRVADLAARAALAAGLATDDVNAVRRAALLHDLGTAGVPNSIWDKPGPLTMTEWERVRLHPYYTERILARSHGLGDLAPLAGAHHERNDATGYHRGCRAGALSLGARIIAAADAHTAMTETRAHRSALSAAVASRELLAAAARGEIDRRAADAVLSAAGAPARTRPEWPGGLSDREVEVLALIVRGRTARDVGRELSISIKTVGSHIEHIYAKIGVSTRGAAALYAMQHGLVTPDR